MFVEIIFIQTTQFMPLPAQIQVLVLPIIDILDDIGDPLKACRNDPSVLFTINHYRQ